MLVTSTTNAGTSSTLDPSVAATFSWTTSPAQAYYEFKWREVKTIIWTTTGRIQSSTMSHTVAANTFTKNKHIEWNVRVWDESQAVSAWYGMDVLIAEAETKQLIKLADQNLKAVSFGKSKVASKVKFKDPDSSIYELDVVSIDDYAASKIRIKQDSGTIVAAAKKLNDYDATVYSDHSNTGSVLYQNHTQTGYSVYSNQTGYSAYTDWVNTGYCRYSDHTNTGGTPAGCGYTNWCNYGYNNWCNYGYNNWCNGGYTAYCNHTNTGYSAYSNWTNSGYGRYSNHSNYKVYIGGGKYSYTQSGYSAYSNWTDSGYGKYSNWTNSGSCGYSNWCNGGYNNWCNGGYNDYCNNGYTVSYCNHTNSGYLALYCNHTNTGYTKYSDLAGYSAYSDHTNTGYLAYSNHSDAFSRSY